jgi:hypothetical protein
MGRCGWIYQTEGLGSGSGRHAVAVVSVVAAVTFDVAFDVAVYGEMGGCESW